MLGASYQAIYINYSNNAYTLYRIEVFVFCINKMNIYNRTIQVALI